MPSIKLQEPVSRADSIGFQLSCDCWQDGHYTFYRNAVPFSFYTGHLYADQLARFFINYADQYPKDQYHIYELGAGTGMLSKHFLDRLKHHRESLYHMTTLNISDSSTDLIRDLERSDFFADHSTRYDITVMDALHPQFHTPADLVLFSNLIDSTPCHHFEIANETIYELLVETSIDEEANIIDGSHYPPTYYTAHDIPALLSTSNPEQAFSLRSQLGPHLIETTQRIKLEDSNLSSSSQQKVLDVVNSQQLSNGSLFNVHFKALEAIDSMLEQSCDTGCIVISDFGFFTDNLAQDFSELSKRYSNHLFTSVYFDSFKRTHNVFNTTNHQKQSETMILSKDENAHDLLNTCQPLFTSSQEITQKIDTIGTLNGAKDLKAFKDIHHTLPDLSKLNVSFLTHCLNYHLVSGHLELVKLMAEQFIALYKDLALMGYYFLGVYGLLTQQRNLAMDNFDKTLSISGEQFHHAYLHLAQLANDQNDIPLAISYYKKVLHYGSVSDKELAIQKLQELV